MSSKNSSNFSHKDDFEDFFSFAPTDDLEDISSGKSLFEDEEKDDFEDLSSGRDDYEIQKPENSFFNDDFFTELSQEFSEQDNKEQPPRREINTTPEKMPYSYHYNDAKHEPQFAKNGDEIFSESEKPARNKKPRKHLGRNITLGVIAVLLAILIILGATGVGKVKKALSHVDTKPLAENKYISASELKSSPDVQNILLIGSDARENEDPEKTRSDTMLLISIDRKNQQIKLTSFLRDMYVDIPGYRKDKINAAHSKGGTQMLCDTIEADFKIDIDGYVLVTFDIFRELIDALGGVDVDVTKKEAQYINSHDHMTPEDIKAFPEELTEGTQHFSGAQALWYSRIRYLDSDFMRTARQRKVLSALMKSAAKKNPSTLFKVAEKVLPLLRTSYTGDELLELTKTAPKLLSYQTVQQQIPAEGTYKSQKKRGQSCLIPDMKKNVEILHKFIFEKAEVKEEKTEKKK